MMRIVKRLLIALTLLLCGLMIAAAIMYALAQSRPAYYKTFAWDDAQRSVINQRAVNKLLQTQNLAARSQAAERRAELGEPSTTGPATRPLSVSLTEEELNAFLLHNTDAFKAQYQVYLKNPAIFLRNGQIILSAEVKDLRTVVSACFEPRISGDGSVRLTLVRSMAGRLPVPKALLDHQFGRIRTMIQQNLPQWRRTAAMDSTGRTNPAGVALAMGTLLLSALNDEPAEAVLFMPLGQGDRSLPLRLVNLTIADEAMSFTVEPMNRQQRDAFMASLRGNPTGQVPPR